ncbi:Stk1 family PASTA domain-containing Ser/Thr kinase [Aestuariimicrobium ganziense]|uniref:Stk1 family PASTA domain-containing Ser/Thr kinase n=1 Tax=Aestuariimicrobium ganziense TaxID=2773677 RepID=UPI001F1A1972|nr:Stk1 family PASTA domain-containing Ser/Thr kinase [Aestuariimicrobium ganziense]
MTSVSDPMVGRLLDGRYEMLARIARGGMATVYRAIDRRLTRTVAIKVMHDGLSGDTDFARKFDREARSAATLSSPHVVSVFDQGVDDGRPYIVMECVEGCTLRNVLVKEGAMEPLRALDLFESIASALATAHEHRIVHCDVKPENVLISDRGQVKVADFGLARAVTNATATATQGLLIGTVSYIPPELVTHARSDARSDVYAAGIMLYEMLTGTKPYAADVPINVAWMHVHNDVPPPSAQMVDDTDSRRIIPPYLDALVLACTRRMPSDRPRDGRVLLHLVRRARRALNRGIMDDPALTEEMSASMRHDPATLESTVPDPHAGEDTDPGGIVAVVAPPVPVSHRVVSAGSPVSSHSSLSAPTGGFRVRSSTPISPVDAVGWSGGTVVPPPRTSPGSPRSATRQPVPRTRTPRSALTPIFPHISHDPVHKRRRRGLLILVLVLLLAIGGGVGAFAWFEKQSWTSAPTLGGLTQNEAQQLATANGFTITFDPEFSETVRKDTVIRMSPEPGARVKKGSGLHAVVSSGPERFTMPKLTGMALEGAKAELVKNNLVVGKVTQAWHESAKKDTVVSASQQAGSPLKRGTTVDLVVSKGPQPIPITSWAGKKTTEAKAALEKAGFSVSITEKNSDTVAKGLVISQTPDKGEGAKGTKVSLVSSKGPVMVQVPRVAGADEATARTRLANAGLKVSVVYTTPAWLRLNVVAGQDPAAGKMAVKGSTVTIWVS